jgi:hypothetical protein
VTEPSIARLVLDGDKTKNIRGGEKTPIYSKFLFMTAGVALF